MRALGSIFVSLMLCVACSSGDDAPTKAPDGGELEGARCNTQPPGVHGVATPRCANYLACVPTGEEVPHLSKPGICTTYAQEGEACHAKKPCSHPLHCGVKGPRAGTCIPPETVAFGEGCDFHNLLCPANHRCVQTGMEQASNTVVHVYQCAVEVGAGQPCDALHACAGSTCDAATNLCACAATNGCKVGSYCANDECGDTVSHGEACTYDAQCHSSFCFEGKCDSRVGSGMACTVNEKCVSRRCENGKCAP